MSLTVNQKTKLKIARQFVLAGIILGCVYIFYYYGFSDPRHYIVGVIIGAILGLLFSLFELYIFDRGAKRIKFLYLLIFRVSLYLFSVSLIIYNAAAIARIFWWNASYLDVITDPRFINGYVIENFPVAVAYTLFLAFSVNFIRMISRKMGQGVLMSFLTGTYYKPKHQARIIMFLQIKGTKENMVDLGPMKFHKLLSELYYDFTIPIVTHQGIISEYLDDLIVITWSVNKGLANSNSLRTFYAIKDVIQNKKAKYEREFGFIPKIQAGIHIGSVIRAEIGEVKTQLVLHGDTMNTTARILAFTKEHSYEFVASKPLLHMIEIPATCQKESIGLIELKGKEEKAELFKLDKHKK